jgi:hypothetical protein
LLRLDARLALEFTCEHCDLQDSTEVNDKDEAIKEAEARVALGAERKDKGTIKEAAETRLALGGRAMCEGT